MLFKWNWEDNFSWIQIWIQNLIMNPDPIVQMLFDPAR
jgi:hypothetical protein